MPVSSVLAKFEAASIIVILATVASTQVFGAECTAEQKSFKATVDGGTTISHNLIVTGTVQCSLSGWNVRLTRARGKNPRDLILRIETTTPDDTADQSTSDVDVQFLLEDSSAFQTVTIKGGGVDFTVPVVHEQ